MKKAQDADGKCEKVYLFSFFIWKFIIKQCIMEKSRLKDREKAKGAYNGKLFVG